MVQASTGESRLVRCPQRGERGRLRCRRKCNLVDALLQHVLRVERVVCRRYLHRARIDQALGLRMFRSPLRRLGPVLLNVIVRVIPHYSQSIR